MIGTPEKLIGYGSAYLRVIAGGLIITYAYNLFSAILQAVGDTRASLGFLIVATKGNFATFQNRLIEVLLRKNDELKS